MPRLLVAVVIAATACGKPAPPIATIPYEQTFDGPALTGEWHSPSGGWSIVDGRLYNAGAHNVPLWLSASLPKDVRVSFDVESKSDEVDFKFEIYGDGEHHESGYSVILGGWKNTTTLIARRGEHAPRRIDADDASLRAQVAQDKVRAATINKDRKDAVAKMEKLEPNRVYHVAFDKRGNELTLSIDGEVHLTYFDPSPLNGPGADRFAFANWASRLYFDNLAITPVP
ncbi:MAG: hypothetical protein ACAI38_08005 [Myxococcota bacterium]|nr:hypothetical protein [Myxococcota bacterium]